MSIFEYLVFMTGMILGFGWVAISLACSLLLFYMWGAARTERRRFRDHERRLTSVSVHTYKPDNAIVPDRGWLVLHKGFLLANLNNCPLFLAVGKTVVGESRTEAEIYRDASMKELRPAPLIITGKDPTIRETLGEARETISLCKAMGSTRHAAIMLAPHVARTRLLWHKVHPTMNDPEVFLVPVDGPFRYWLWEALMLCVHFIAPPGSKRQGFLLKNVGRKG